MLHISTSTEYQAEKTYILQIMLGELLGLDYQLDWGETTNDVWIKVPGGGSVRIKSVGYYQPIPSDVVCCDHPFEPNEDIVCIYGDPIFSIENQHFTCGIDLFAAAFFMLTRREETEGGHKDRHDRFPAQQSLAWRAGFLHRPVVNEYAALLRALLLRAGWKAMPLQQNWRLHVSCDVDHPRLWWSWPERLKTIAGSIFQRKKPSEASFWIKNHLFSPRDPYNTFNEMMALCERENLPVHFNFLGKRPQNSDCYYPLEHPVVLNLMHDIAKRGHHIGFHPSYEAHGQPERFRQELESLRRLSPLPVRSGRQHFLRFRVPDSWRPWAEADMAWDSSLGYPEAEGFRCGICQEFPVFDHLQRKALTIREKPLIAMDVTLAQYRQYSPERAYDVLCALRHQVKKHGGEFVLLWHNSSFNVWPWRSWGEVFRSFVSQKNL